MSFYCESIKNIWFRLKKCKSSVEFLLFFEFNFRISEITRKSKTTIKQNRFNNQWLLINEMLKLRVGLLFKMAKIATDVIANVIASTRGSNVFVWIASTRLITIVALSFVYATRPTPNAHYIEGYELLSRRRYSAVIIIGLLLSLI